MSDSVEESTADINVSLSDIPTPQTPENNRNQTSDHESPKTESPKPLKPVLGKLQAKKRLMAFVKNYTAIPNPLQKASRMKHKSHNKKSSEDSKSKSKPINLIFFKWKRIKN